MNDLQKFKTLLDSQYQWPNKYLFKFIVPMGELEKLSAIFKGEDISVRPSKKGNYFGVTVLAHKNSSEEVIQIYSLTRMISGILSL